ncbi:MAG: dockerin type I domain-containing protein, partial [Pirellulales bacterium]|nr:dockerin type I domain-containing protein [Pirellulales bacterium]
DRAALDADVTPQFVFTVAATDQGGLADTRTVTVNLLDVTDPITLPIDGVKVASSAWTNAGFLNAIDPVSQEGYLLVDAVAPTETISWSNVDRLLVKFGEDMATRINDLTFSLSGINVPSYTLVPAYDQSTQTTTLQLNTALDTDKLLLTITDTANVLEHSLRFDVLPGDLTNNGVGSVSDIGPLRAAMNTFVGNANYDPYADLNGSGAVAIDDIGPLRDHINVFLPVGQPALQRVTTILDVSLDGQVSALDALRVINLLDVEQRASGEVPVETIPQFFSFFYRDSKLTALDALLIINFIGRQQHVLGEAESEAPLTSSVEQSEDRKRDSVWKPAA